VYKSIKISNFKVFENFKIEGLSEINVITGMNNVGKTNLLESVYLLIGCSNLALLLNINSSRGLTSFAGDPAIIQEAMVSPFFLNLQTDHTITLEGELTDGSVVKSIIKLEPEKYLIVPPDKSSAVKPSAPPPDITGQKLTLTFSHGSQQVKTSLSFGQQGPRIEPIPPAPLFRGHFVSSHASLNPLEEATLFSEREKIGEGQSIVESLKILEPKLKRLAVLVSAGNSLIHADIGLQKMVPLPLMGDGLRRMTKILLAIANSPNGVVLIDDIEFGIHHSNILKIWRSIVNAATRSKTQIFVTTHSYEWIRGAADIAKESLISNMSLYRLERDNSQIKIISYDRESLGSAVEADLEVR
jgi:hypothetical protein